MGSSPEALLLFILFAAFSNPSSEFGMNSSIVGGDIIERVSAKIGLAVNGCKAKYMQSTCGNVPHMGCQITANSYNFDVVKKYIFLGNPIKTNNDISLAIKGIVILANRCYFGLNRQLSSRLLSCDEINTLQALRHGRCQAPMQLPCECWREQCSARFLVQ